MLIFGKKEKDGKMVMPQSVDRENDKNTRQTTSSQNGKGGILVNWQGLVVIALLCVLLFIQIVSGIMIPLLKTSTTRPSLTEWEYIIATPDDEEFDTRMKNLGDEGWELVSSRRATSKFGGPKYEMIFKRPKIRR